MKINLLKKLLCLSPVVISPILVTACGNDTHKEKHAQFYLDFYQKELNAIWSTKTADINSAATDSTADHKYNLQIGVLNEVITKVKTDGAAEFKKEFPNLNNYDASIFNDIAISFSIPKDSSGNLKVADNDILSVYPTSIISGSASEKQISYTLKLNSSKLVSTALAGSLKLNLQAGFINYSTSSSNPLANNNINSIYGNADMSTILVGTYGGLDVGTRGASGGYSFVNYNTSSKNKLNSDKVLKIYGNADLSTILVGEDGGGLDVGTRQADGKYNFTNYSTSSSGSKLANNSIQSVYGNKDLSTILVGENGGGLDLGTRAKPGDPYTFTNYSTSSSNKINSDYVFGAYANPDLSTILLGENGQGLDVGTKAKASDPYTFKHYNTSSSGSEKLASNNVYDVYATSDLSTILLGTLTGGLDVGTRAKASDPYAFTAYNTSGSGNKKLANNRVYSVYGNADLSKILVGENYGGGLDVGAKQADGSYTFANYNDSSSIKLTNGNVSSVYGNADLSTILVGEYTDGGLDISSNLWFA